jgi:tetratricopeptide (TPR) repeat protein
LAALLFAGAALAAAAEGSAASSRFPELLPSERLAAIGALPDPLPLPRLVEASLLCSGVAPDRAPSYAERVEALLAEARSTLGPAAVPGDGGAALGAALLDFLHSRVFRAYAERATTLDGVLDSGQYNCVSSALLYIIAGSALGLDVSGSRTADHALCVVRAGARSIDVETTNPYGFDPGTRKEFKDSFGRTTGFAYTAPGAYSGRKALSGRGMAGLVLSNRASLLERAGRFREALALGADYYALCRDADSEAFLADRVNNVVADLSARGDHAGAEELAFEALARLPGDSAVARLAGETLEALASELASRGDYEGARRALEARRGAADAAAFARASAAVGDAELVAAANALPFGRAVAAADRMLAAGQVAPGRYAQAIATIYGREASRLGAAGDWLAAAALAEEGAAKAPGDGGLSRAAASMRRNFVVVSHNAFAALFNSGDYAGARAAAESALGSVPGDATLLRDLEAAKAAQAR